MPESSNILVVEDYEPDAHLLSILLKKNRVANGLQVVRDGTKALDFLFARGPAASDLPGVVLLDIRLPRFDGWEVLRQIRANPQTRTLPVVMLSGAVYEEEEKKAIESGANGCLAKPVRFEAFRDLLSSMGFKWSFLQ